MAGGSAARIVLSEQLEQWASALVTRNRLRLTTCRERVRSSTQVGTYSATVIPRLRGTRTAVLSRGRVRPSTQSIHLRRRHLLHFLGLCNTLKLHWSSIAHYTVLHAN